MGVGMEDHTRPVEDGGAVVAVEAATRRELSEAERYFCMRIALGDSVAGASRAVQRDARTGFRWLQRPEIEEEIRKAAAQAVDSARRVIVGKVRWAARRMVQLASPGGSQHKGANVEFAALKYILDVNRVSEIQVGGTQSRILTFIPRDERDAPDDLQDTLSVIEAQYREDTLPLVPTADGLPPDFPRAEGERDGGYAVPAARSIPTDLNDPGYYRKSLLRE
jgi:hypothetical protein